MTTTVSASKGLIVGVGILAGIVAANIDKV
jgi:hypothetical protein